MKRNLTGVAVFAAALLSSCVAAPEYEPAATPPPAVGVAPPAVAVQPYLYAHWGHYYRGPYSRVR